jgi:hypothetical protein
MSMALTVYLVDLAKARAAIGSRDDKLRRQICGRFKADLERADEWFSSEIEGGAPKRYDAMKAVFDGGPFERRGAFQYGYAYEMIVRHFGKYLNNNDFSPFRGDWLEQVDRGMQALGLSLRVTPFMYGRVPDPLPRPADFPGYGEWSHAQCSEGLSQWRTRLNDRSNLVADSQVLAAIESCSEWMLAAVEKPGAGIAGFGY